MNYIETPITLNKVSKKWVNKQVTDINKMTTFRILLHVYRRHEILILYLALGATYTWAIMKWMFS